MFVLAFYYHNPYTHTHTHTNLVWPYVFILVFHPTFSGRFLLSSKYHLSLKAQLHAVTGETLMWFFPTTRTSYVGWHRHYVSIAGVSVFFLADVFFFHFTRMAAAMCTQSLFFSIHVGGGNTQLVVSVALLVRLFLLFCFHHHLLTVSAVEAKRTLLVFSCSSLLAPPSIFPFVFSPIC